jgi:hypothetical protein
MLGGIGAAGVPPPLLLKTKNLAVEHYNIRARVRNVTIRLPFEGKQFEICVRSDNAHPNRP